MSIIRTKATVDQNIDLAVQLFTKGVEPVESIEWLKSQHYVVKGVTYNATSVASAINGMRRLELAVTSGKATITKTKGFKLK
jgi:hypothetical protein